MPQAHAAPAGSKADASRIRILDEAARLFRQRGYSLVSLRDIAGEVGMKPGSVYYHFASKKEIVLEILDTGIFLVHDEVSNALTRLPADTPAAQLLHAGILGHLRSLFEFSDYTSASVRLHHQVPEDVRGANVLARRRYDRLWDGILERIGTQCGVRADIDVATFRAMLISALNATLDWFDGRRGEIGPLAERYASILMHGLLPDAGCT